MTTKASTWLLGAALAFVAPQLAGCSRATTQALAVGAQAPALKQAAHDGTMIDLGEGGRMTLVYFYPKDGTPGCTKEACAFRDVWDRYTEAGVQLIGVSTDSDASHREFAKEHQLPFPLIADEDKAWAEAFGVETTLGFTARDSFLIGPDRVIRAVYRGVDPGVHAEQVLADAKR